MRATRWGANMPSAASLGAATAAARRAPPRPISVGRGRWVLAALVGALIALRAVSLLYDHSLHSIDGAMQTWFALSGFASGAQLGAEFQSYLGVTMMLALLPVFAALGQTLFASTFAAYAAVTLGAFVSAYAIVWFVRPIPKHQRVWWTILIVFAFYFLGRAPFDAIGYPYPAHFEPGVSLRPIRGLLPFLALPFVVVGLRKVRETGSARPAALLGAVAGFGLLWSNDAGIPLFIAMGMALVAALIGRWGLMAKSLAAFALTTLASAAALLTLVTQGSPLGWLQYNFVSVAADQFWYFGPWDREARVLGPLDLLNIARLGNPLSVLSLISLAVCGVIALARRARGRGAPVREAAFIAVGASLVGTALIPQIGGHIGAEYNHITFVIGCAAPFIVFQRAAMRWAKALMRALPGAALRMGALAAAALMVALGVTSTSATVQASERTVYDRNLGFFVTPQYAADIAAMKRLLDEYEPTGRGAPERTLTSVYTSALDVGAGAISAAPVGSIIHALGQDYRWSYEALPRRRTGPPVVTIAPDYSGWEGWNLRANWPFFARLRARYAPIARNDQHVVWLPTGQDLTPRAVECRVTPLSPSSFSVALTGDAPGLATVLVRRDAIFAEGSFTPPRGALLTVSEDSPFTRAASGEPWGGFPRYGVGNTHAVSVPAPLEPGEVTTLTLDVMDGSAIGEATCRAFAYPEPDVSALPSLPEGIGRYLADQGR